MRSRIATVCWALLAGLLCTPKAQAAEEGQRSVLVLGIRSLEGDDALALRITDALSAEAARVPGYEVGERKVSLAQMMLAHGCDEPDASCLADIAESLKVRRLIYGTLRRTGVGDRYDFDLALASFDADRGQIEHSIAAELPGQGAIELLERRVARWVARLSGQPPTGELQVTVNVPGALVEVDGERVGTADAESGLVKAEVLAGRHRVEVGAEGYGTFRGTVTVAADEEASIEVELEERASGPLAAPGTTPPGERVVYRSRVAWPTYVGFAAATVFTGLTVFAFVRLDNIKEDETVLMLDDTPPRSFDVACSRAVPAGNLEAVDLCQQADRLEPLRWVFLSLTVVAAGASGYLLWNDLRKRPKARVAEEAAAAEPRWVVTGGVDRQSAHLSTTFRF